MCWGEGGGESGEVQIDGLRFYVRVSHISLMGG